MGQDIEAMGIGEKPGIIRGRPFQRKISSKDKFVFKTWFSGRADGMLFSHLLQALNAGGNLKMRLHNLFIVSILFTLSACSGKSTVRSRRPLIPKDTTKKLEKANSLLAFVGKKISIKELPYEQGSLDNAFFAKYEILENVYGDCPADTIEFWVFDHYGIPSFSKFDNVLLFVSKADTFYYHEKYMYNDVYKTKDGRWAGSYTYDYDNLVNRNIGIKPVKLDFEYDVFYLLNKDDTRKGIKYPSPYFEVKDGKAKVIYGNYLEDLFMLKKFGTLAYRGLFGDTIPKFPEVEVKEVYLEEIKK